MDELVAVLGMKTLFLFGLALWFSFAILNNITDSGTNTFLIGQMMRMDLLEEDPNMGNGIKWRALMSPVVHKAFLRVVVVVQVTTVALLWIAVYKFASIWMFHPAPVSIANATVFGDIALGAFAAIWIWFWTGGMWFGYWMKTPQIQQVHMTLLIMAMVAFMVINYPNPRVGGSSTRPTVARTVVKGGATSCDRS